MTWLVSLFLYHLGLRTDAASSTGSLHAKTTDIKNTLAAVTNVKSWQSITFTPTTTSTTVTISSVNPAKVMVFLNGHYAYSTSAPYIAMPYIDSVGATSIVIKPGLSITGPTYAPMSLIVVELY